MKWINIKDQAPPKEEILVFCKRCKMSHSVIYDFHDFCLIQYCGEQGYYHTGCNVKFDYWMPLPETPKNI